MQARLSHFLPLALLLAGPAQADMQRGAELHQKNCIGCHASITGGDGTALYTRADHRVKSLAALDRQVRRCTQSQRLRWDDGQIGDVVKYLDAHYYRFTP